MQMPPKEGLPQETLLYSSAPVWRRCQEVGRELEERVEVCQADNTLKEEERME